MDVLLALNAHEHQRQQGGTSGASSIDGLPGVNFYARSGIFKGHRLAVELSKPVYQDLDGPAQETDWMVIAGWQLAIKQPAGEATPTTGLLPAGRADSIMSPPCSWTTTAPGTPRAEMPHG